MILIDASVWIGKLAGATLWTRDKRLDLAADRLGLRAGIERRH